MIIELLENTLFSMDRALSYCFVFLRMISELADISMVQGDLPEEVVSPKRLSPRNGDGRSSAKSVFEMGDENCKKYQIKICSK
jgi:hypothetical protein